MASKSLDESLEKEWPAIDSADTDEYRQIQSAVYIAAGMIRREAECYAIKILRDAQAGHDLLSKAVGIVSLKITDPNNQIEDLAAYLFQAYKRLVLNELSKENRRSQILAERQAELRDLTIDLTEDIDRKVLLEQIVRQMDPWMREIFEWLCLDYTFEMIADATGGKANALRSRYSKRLKQLISRLERESNEATDKSLKRRSES